MFLIVYTALMNPKIISRSCQEKNLDILQQNVINFFKGFTAVTLKSGLITIRVNQIPITDQTAKTTWPQFLMA